MRVKELIEILKTKDGNSRVAYEGDDNLITGVGHAYLDFDYFDAVASDSVPTVQIDGVDLEEVVFLNRSKRWVKKITQ